MPPSQPKFCSYTMTTLATSSLCSSLFIVNMTFDGFYSIIRPHKAASFNTLKRAKVTIISAVVFSAIYSIPHIFMTSVTEYTCLVYFKGMDWLAGRIYFYSGWFVTLGFPFVSLLIMNCIIINKLCNRSKPLLAERSETQGQNSSQSHPSKMKSSEKQITLMLLFVTFGFLILMIPAFCTGFYPYFVDFNSSPELYAGFHLIMAVGQKSYYTNFCINFYLYVMSGHKFRSDLVKLFQSMCSCFQNGINLFQNNAE